MGKRYQAVVLVPITISYMVQVNAEDIDDAYDKALERARELYDEGDEGESAVGEIEIYDVREV